jgi:hypothetical protein
MGMSHIKVTSSSLLWKSHVPNNIRNENIECPNKRVRSKVRAIIVLLSWRHWKFDICHLSFLRLVVMERYTKEHSVIIFLNK